MGKLRLEQPSNNQGNASDTEKYLKYRPWQIPAMARSSTLSCTTILVQFVYLERC